MALNTQIFPEAAIKYGKHPVRLTALLYLRQAILEEEYESCPEIIKIAREFGAESSEIRFLLEDPRRSPAA